MIRTEHKTAGRTTFTPSFDLLPEPKAPIVGASPSEPVEVDGDGGSVILLICAPKGMPTVVLQSAP